MTRLRRRRIAALLCVLAACGGGAGGEGDGGEAAAPGPVDEVRIAAGEDIWPLTGQGRSAKHFAAGDLNVGVYEPLLRLGPDFTAQPGLAERWELVAPQTWRFHLRHGVRFHDGRPFGAEDVVWSWTGRQFLPTAITDTLSTVTRVDDHTVDFVLSRPNLRLPEQLVHPEGPIVPKDGHNDSTPPVGTGPFRVVDYRPRQRVVVERYDGYWGEKAALPRLTFQFLPDPETRIEALREGDVAIALNVPWKAAAALEADGRFRVVRGPVGATQSLSFNVSGTPPSELAGDPAIRRAVATAVDRRAYVAEVLGGEGEPGRWLAPPAVLGTSASLVDVVPHDPAVARSVLDEAGWRPAGDGVRTRGGRRLTLTLVGGPAVPGEGLRFVQSQLRAVGVEVAVKEAEDTVTYRQYRDAGYDLDLTMSNQNDANPAFLAARAAAEGDVAAALEADSREAVQRLSVEMMRRIAVEELHVVPLAHVARISATRQGVELGDPHPSALNQSWTAVTVRS